MNFIQNKDKDVQPGGKARTVIGGWIFVYTSLPHLFVLKVMLISKEVSQVELNIWVFTPPPICIQALPCFQLLFLIIN